MSELVTVRDLKGASVFITGGVTGMDAALAEGFIKQDANVAFVPRVKVTGLVTHMQEKQGVVVNG